MNDDEFALLYAVQRDSDMQEEALNPESELAGLIRNVKQESELWEEF